jgi:hypothetical protein
MYSLDMFGALQREVGNEPSPCANFINTDIRNHQTLLATTDVYVGATCCSNHAPADVGFATVGIGCNARR